jgi:hypothetical protein
MKARVRVLAADIQAKVGPSEANVRASGHNGGPHAHLRPGASMVACKEHDYHQYVEQARTTMSKTIIGRTISARQ